MISRPTHHFLAYRLRFFYCATQSFFIEDHIEKNEVNRATLREVMRSWRQHFLKLVQISTLFLFLKRNPLGTKQYCTLFSLTDSGFVIVWLKFFLFLRIIHYKKWCKSDHLERRTIQKYCKKKFPTYLGLLGFVRPYNRKHTYFLAKLKNIMVLSHYDVSIHGVYKDLIKFRQIPNMF